MAEKYDVILIGGGIMGCSCAFTLAQRGLKVGLFEKSSIGEGPTGTLIGDPAHSLLERADDANGSVRIAGLCRFRKSGRRRVRVSSQRFLDAGSGLRTSRARRDSRPAPSVGSSRRTTGTGCAARADAGARARGRHLWCLRARQRLCRCLPRRWRLQTSRREARSRHLSRNRGRKPRTTR